MADIESALVERGGGCEAARALREVYLAELTRCLQDRLSPLETFDQVAEIRSHLDSMAQAYVEVGISPDRAMQSAVAKFGRADTLGSKISCALRGDRRVSPIPAGLILLILFNLTVAAACSEIFNLAMLLVYNHMAIADPNVPAVQSLPIGTNFQFGIALALVTWHLPQLRPIRTALFCVLLENLVAPILWLRTTSWLSLYLLHGVSFGLFCIAFVSTIASKKLRNFEGLRLRRRAI